MKKDYVRDGKGNIIGTTTKFSTGDTVVRDGSGTILGRSSDRYGNTRDASGKIVLKNAIPGYLFKR